MTMRADGQFNTMGVQGCTSEVIASLTSWSASSALPKRANRRAAALFLFDVGIIALLHHSGIGIELSFLAGAEPSRAVHGVNQCDQQDDGGDAIGDPIEHHFPSSMVVISVEGGEPKEAASCAVCDWNRAPLPPLADVGA
jgi:hypothetical protein